MLVQEVSSYRPAVRPERRRQMQQEAEAAAPNALHLLATCLNQKGIALISGYPVHKHFRHKDSAVKTQSCHHCDLTG